MQEFGKSEYKQTAYINFESSKNLATLFDSNFDVNRIISALEIEAVLLYWWYA